MKSRPLWVNFNRWY